MKTCFISEDAPLLGLYRRFHSYYKKNKLLIIRAENSQNLDAELANFKNNTHSKLANWFPFPPQPL